MRHLCAGVLSVYPYDLCLFVGELSNLFKCKHRGV